MLNELITDVVLENNILSKVEYEKVIATIIVTKITHDKIL